MYKGSGASSLLLGVSLVYSNWSICLTLQQYHTLGYHSFILSFEIRNSESVNIVLFFQDSFGYSPSAKNVIEILIHMALNL